MKNKRIAGFALLATALLVWDGHRSFTRAAKTDNPRAALVIANASYPDDKDAPLPGVLAHAQAFGEMLKKDGYTVEMASNASKSAMRDVIDRFTRTVGHGGTVLVYFSGFGIQSKGRNYLIPVDAKIRSDDDVHHEGIALDALLDKLTERGARTRAVVLDASRRNPFERRYRSYANGLAPIETKPGTVILCSAAAGQTLNDTETIQSQFVPELIRELAVSDRTIEQAFVRTRESVSKERRVGQAPALYPSSAPTRSRTRADGARGEH